VIGQAEIRRLLPHRYPMLLVDRVRVVEPGVRLVAEKAVTAAEPWFGDGYPRVLVAESWAQSAGVLAALSVQESGFEVVLLGGMKGIEFLADPDPGDVVEHHVRLVRAAGESVLFEGHAEVRGKTLMKVASMTMALPRKAGG
jgi:3-hydroxyacyl-[acyl-carrier-protein] dehydratase